MHDKRLKNRLNATRTTTTHSQQAEAYADGQIRKAWPESDTVSLSSDPPTRPSPSGPGPNIRVALYSHDTMGIGHVRRNLLVALALDRCPVPPTMLLITGSREAGWFKMPLQADVLSVPGVSKESNGVYCSRHLTVPFDELIELRARAIAGALAAFAPHLLIVDKVPLGASGELEGAIRTIRSQCGTRCVLGLRDILDENNQARRDWKEFQYERAINELYDAVWIYGDRDVYDAVAQYEMSSQVASRVQYTGYLDARPWLDSARRDRQRRENAPRRNQPRLALCLLGGGQDGARLAEDFASVTLPSDMRGLVVAGPYMPPQALRRVRQRVAENPSMSLVDFVVEPTELLCDADRVVCMGGYNTLCEVLSLEKQALVVPRVYPRQEQLVRAQRLHELGLVDLMMPDDVTPRAIEKWIALPATCRVSARTCVDFRGLARIPRLFADLCGLSAEATPEATLADEAPTSFGTP